MTADTMTGYQCTVAGFFDTRQAAEKARDDLVRAGFSRDQVTVIPGQESTAPPTQPTGFWESLKGIFLPEEDRHSFSEGLRRGGCLVSVRTSQADRDRAADVLERDGAVDLSEKEAQWRSEGWKGYHEGIPSTGTVSAPAKPSPKSQQSGAGAAAASATTAKGTMAKETAKGTMAKEEAIPVAEEQIRVGKRDVSSGRVRVRSYVTEEPVAQDVKLRSENVAVERRPVDRAASPGDAAFKERVVEAEQHREEPVVSKEARVKEEVRLRKDAQEHTERVSDKVRRTKVEVEDERGKPEAGTSSTGKPKT